MVYDFLESFLYFVLSTFSCAYHRKQITKDLSTIQTKVTSSVDGYIITTVKIWSVFFLIVVAGMILWTKQYLSIFQMNTFLIISLSGLFIDQFSLSGYVFVTMASLSWFELFSLFMNTPAGISLNRFTEPRWVMAFYLMTSVALAGHLDEKHKVLRSEVSYFQLSFVVLVWSSLPLLFATSHFFLPELLPLMNGWNEVPVRLVDLEVGNFHRIITLFFMIMMHFGTRSLILSVDDENDGSAADKRTKKNDETPSDSNHTGKRNQKEFKGKNTKTVDSTAEEGGPPEDDAASAELPGDAVEVSEEEALRLCDEARLKQRKPNNKIK